MQFQVPQFIDVEDKIFGPLTFRQFIYVAGGAGMSYLLWRIVPSYISIPLIAVVGGTAAALAFLQWNGQPFILAVEHGFFYLIRSKLYLWNNERARVASAASAAKKASKAVSAGPVYTPKLSDSRLHELAWSLDINERIAAGVVSDEEREGLRRDALAQIRTAQEARI